MQRSGNTSVLADYQVKPQATLLCKRAWARLPAEVYEVDPFVCPKCGAQMKVTAIIEDLEELRRILRHLVKIGRSPPGFNPDRPG